jgi:hypothetical protein
MVAGKKDAEAAGSTAGVDGVSIRCKNLNASRGKPEKNAI